jgi:hypothetical protein
MTARTPPEGVRALLAAFLERLDDDLPGHIDGLYLVGSLAVDDYRPGRSDVDFVAVVREHPTTGVCARLAGVHQSVARESPRPFLDGVYVTWPGLRQNPVTLTAVPFTHEGRFHESGAFEANPAVWLTLRDHAFAVRGPEHPDVWHDPEELRRWTVDNLGTYWRGLAREVDAAMAAGRTLPEEAIAWCVPGVLRLRYTLATGRITSKSGACRYGLETLPARWHPIVQEALALHRGNGLTGMDSDRRGKETLALMETVIDESLTASLTQGDS